MYNTHNKQVACAPFESVAVEIEKKNNFAFAKQKSALVETKVLYGYTSKDLALTSGTKVFIDGEIVKVHPWSKKVYTLNGVSFILVPEQYILVSEWQNT